MHSPHSINQHNKGLDDLEYQEEIDKDECAIQEEDDIDCSAKEKKVRGQTSCKNIHARNLEEREQVTFDKGQAVGSAVKIVSKLTNFLKKNCKEFEIHQHGLHYLACSTKRY